MTYPATEAQIAYATTLGIHVSDDETVESLSNKIRFTLDPKQKILADDSVLEQAKYFGIRRPDSYYRDHVLSCIKSSLIVGNRTFDMCHWYVYRVYLHLERTGAPEMIKHDGAIAEVAFELMQDSKFVTSIEREFKRSNLDKFGKPDDGYGVYSRIASMLTYAYKTASTRLGEQGII